MNTRPPIEAPNEPAVLSVAFNNDNSRFAVGIDSGFGSEDHLSPVWNYVIKPQLTSSLVFQSSTCKLQASKGESAREARENHEKPSNLGLAQTSTLELGWSR